MPLYSPAPARPCYASEVDYQTLRLHLEAPVSRIVLARPDEGNRFNLRALRELGEACEEIGGKDGVCLTLLTGEGPDFCLGWADDAREALRSSMDHLDPFGCLARLPVPVLAGLHGNVGSAGLELALACDMRIAREDVRFSFPDVSDGFLPLAGAAARLPRIAGRTVASAILLLGEELDANAAYRCGLVSRVVEAGEFESQMESIAARVTANGPLALRYAKELVHNGTQIPLDHALRYELDLSVILQTTRDRAEGVQAFLDKRSPDFEGR